MTAYELRAVSDFERSLKPGDAVLARWTWSYGDYAAEATVVRVNRSSIRVALTRGVEHYGGSSLPVGREIVVPTLTAIDRWSCRNRVEPVDGYKDIEVRS